MSAKHLHGSRGTRMPFQLVVRANEGDGDASEPAGFASIYINPVSLYELGALRRLIVTKQLFSVDLPMPEWASWQRAAESSEPDVLVVTAQSFWMMRGDLRSVSVFQDDVWAIARCTEAADVLPAGFIRHYGIVFGDPLDAADVAMNYYQEEALAHA